ncbi:MAG: glycosyltransferase [Pacificimonas sp.]|jgi:glycosyltransferase involved in cell wall biosynthesis|nr:glycosyltransferase [Pacificimonas sp.]
MSIPAVSILMSVRDGERFLPSTLASLRAQTFADVEYVVIDDGSTDRTGRILDRFADRQKRVTLLRNKVSRGLAASLNLGLRECRANLVARADADDIHMPSRLAKQVSFLEGNGDAGLVSCGFRRIDAAGEVIDVETAMTDPDLIAFAMMFETPILHPGAMFRRKAVREIGGYDETLWTAQDSDLWLRLRETTRLANIAEPLVDYRVHDGGIVARRGKKGDRLSHKVKQRALSEYCECAFAIDEAAAAVEMMRGYHKLTKTNVETGRRMLRRVRKRAAVKEPKAVLGWFDERYRRGHIAQAQYHGGSDPGFAARLAAHAFRKRPGLYTASLASRLGWKSLSGGARDRTR